MANTSISLVNLDFDTLKQGFKTFLQSQNDFKDYDYEGSNINVLLDLLSYNTYLNGFYMNMVVNEMFLDTAQLRENIISRAKELNYVPRSFQSAKANVIIQIETDNTVPTVTIPKGTQFITRVGNVNYAFVTAETIIATGSGKIKSTPQIYIYEGPYTTDTFVYNSSSIQNFILSNPTIDTSSLTVLVSEDNGASVLEYDLSTSLYDKNSLSQIYFLQMSEQEKYEILFGDGITGRTPKNNSVIIAQYRVTNGELPNGSYEFESAGAIQGFANVTVSTISSASGGLVSESIESIKFNAPRYFTSQERAITAEDYATLLKINFPEINTVNAYGGEDENPPQYGKVFVAVDLKDIDGVPVSKKEEFYKFLKSRCSLAIDPVIVNPSYNYVKIDSLVRYNINITSKSAQTIRSLVFNAIENYNTNTLSDFNKTLRYSKFVNVIDNADPSILSNDTSISIVKQIDFIRGAGQNYYINFNQSLENDFSTLENPHPSNYQSIISSNKFFTNNELVELEDNGLGEIFLVKAQVNNNVSEHVQIKKIGNIDYRSGILNLFELVIDSVLNDSVVKIYAKTKYKDILAINSSILKIDRIDVNIEVIQERV